jgi:cytoskeletal protein RodZ
MLFNARKESFFLNLESGNDQSTTVVLTPPMGRSADQVPEEQPSAPAEMSLTIAADSGTEAAVSQSLQTASTSAAPTSAVPKQAVQATADPTTTVLTTAEAIAAQLAADQEARPASPMATFAPDYLLPGNGLTQRRRRPGASMKIFRTIAGDLFRS